jgi:hypothetical protein
VIVSCTSKFKPEDEFDVLLRAVLLLCMHNNQNFKKEFY